MWEGDGEEGQGMGGACQHRQGQAPGLAKHLTGETSCRGVYPSQLGWGEQELGSRGCCWKLALRLDLKGALVGKAQIMQTEPARHRWSA